jgi:prophage regulatory protein
VTRHLVGLAELAEMLAVSKQRAVQIADAYSDFPAPEVDLASGRVWRRADVERWIRKHPVRRPGRPTMDA